MSNLSTTTEVIKKDDYEFQLHVAKEALRLADERPDFIYSNPNAEANAKARWQEDVDLFGLEEIGEFDFTNYGQDCLYVHTAEDGSKVGGCLFGQALLNLGASAAELSGYEGSGVSAIVSSSYIHEGPLVDAMRSTQVNQDNKTPWGEAVEPLRKAVEAL